MAVSVEQFQRVLLHSFSSNIQERQAAEQQLHQLKTVEGFYELLLHFATQPYPREIRQAAAIVVKNQIKQNWALAERAEANQKPVPPEAVKPKDKALVRELALEGLMRESDPPVRNLLAEVVNILINFDYPDNWPQLLGVVVSAIQSGNALYMHNGLLALRKLCKKFEYKPRSDREGLYVIIRAAFPTLQQIMAGLLESPSVEGAEMMRLSLKAFWSATQFALPTCLPTETLLQWMEMVNRLLAKQLPEAHEGLEPAGQPTDDEDRKRWPWWKVKKWAITIATRFYTRYGQPRYADDSDHSRQFAKVFYEQVAPAMLHPVLEMVCLRSRGRYVTDRVLNMCLEYTLHALDNAPTYRIIKPHAQFLLVQVVFPLVVVTARSWGCSSTTRTSSYARDAVRVTATISTTRGLLR
jgi:importin-7